MSNQCNCHYKKLAPIYKFLYDEFGLLNCSKCGMIVREKNSKKHWSKHVKSQ